MTQNPPQPPIKVALVYDFDGTLAPGNIQEHSLFRDLGVEPQQFWEEVETKARTTDSDGTLVYMQEILKYAKNRGISVTQDYLRRHGSMAPLFKGVDGWFDRINDYARKECKLQLEHYIVSSANRELVEGTPVARNFQQIFACKYIYNKAGRAIWPGVVVNYTTKTQFLFRINKGILNFWDNDGINRWMDQADRPVPFTHLIFLGDGDTDIPAMKLVRTQGGYSIAVFDPENWKSAECQRKIHKLIAEDRVSYAAEGDYRKASLLDVTIKGILLRIARLER